MQHEIVKNKLKEICLPINVILPTLDRPETTLLLYRAHEKASSKFGPPPLSFTVVEATEKTHKTLLH